jgi:hypothetical protein
LLGPGYVPGHSSSRTNRAAVSRAGCGLAIPRSASSACCVPQHGHTTRGNR